MNIGGRTLFDRKDLDELIEKTKSAGQQPVKQKGRKGRPRKDELSADHKKSAKTPKHTKRG